MSGRVDANDRPAISTRRDLAIALLILVALPCAAHALFSPLGFNPTDDGFILAYSRRLLEGQVPHRDFISIRPVLSAWIHAPAVLVGGDRTYWLARLVVWLELALIAWAWTRLFARSGTRAFGTAEILVVSLVAFVATSFTFPVMPWHTIDALALASAGLVLAVSPSRARKVLGYSLLGAATLCRQNFLPLAPIAALVLGDRRDQRVGLAVVAPLGIYAGVLLATGALGAAVQQIGAQTGFLEYGVRPYLSSSWCGAGVVLGAVIGWLVVEAGRAEAGPARLASLLARALGWGFAFAVAAAMMGEMAVYLRDASFALFGASLGTTAMLAACGRRDATVRLGALAVLLAWCTSVSIGMNTPALAAGPLIVHLLFTVGPAWSRGEGHRARIARFAAPLAVATAFAVTWVSARLEVIYREGAAAELTAPIDTVWPGGRGVRTNPRTYGVLADLDRAVDRAGDRPVAIVADFCGYWVKADRQNPISIDWPQATELHSDALRARVLADLERLRGHGSIVVQKLHAGALAERLLPIDEHDSYYFVPQYVRARFRKTGGTRWFDVYE